MKCANLKKIILKFSKREENLNKILGTQKVSFNKERISFNSFNRKAYYKSFFIESTNYKSETAITCICCCEIGHISSGDPNLSTYITVL